MRFEIKINELKKEVWDFTLIRETLFLNGYSLQEKESKRHRKYQTTKRYDRLMGRNSTIKESEVPFTDEIKQKALQTYFETIDCKRWSER